MGCTAFKVISNEVKPLWRSKAVLSHHSDAIILDNYLYSFSGKSAAAKGDFKCIDLATGKEMWSTKLLGNGTVICVNGLLICLDYKGGLYLVEPSHEKFILLSEIKEAFPIVKGFLWTSPVAADGKLYLRYRQRLLCYDLISTK